MKYRSEIDGLRAVAVIPVVLFHAGLESLSGGFVGVDIFFVISGYLITSILIKELKEGRLSIASFYERRVRRILPALTIVVISCLPFAWFWMLPEQLIDFSRSLVAVGTFSSNILFWLETGYFAPESELKPLLHTWSLAVEEQFYLFFPILLLLVWRLGERWVGRILVGLVILSFAACLWMSQTHPTANFYLSLTRFWELALGSLCALTKFSVRGFIAEGAAIIGLFLIALSIVIIDDSVPFPSFWALLPTIGTVLIINFGREGSLVARLLSAKPIVFIGLLSYSTYLWHQPLFAFARLRSVEEPNIMLMLSLALASFGLAFFSWRYVEQPFRSKGDQALVKGRGTVLGVGLAVLASISFLGLMGHWSTGYPNRFEGTMLASSDEFDLPSRRAGYCFYNMNRNRGLETGSNGHDCHLAGGENAETTALLFGDSFAGQWEPFWELIGARLNLDIEVLTTNWCSPTLGEAFTGPRTHPAFQQCLLNRDYLVQELSDFDVVILAGQWHAMATMGYSTALLDTIDYILAESDARVVIMPSPPAVERNSIERLVYTGNGQIIRDQARDSEAESFQSRIAEHYSDEPRVRSISQSDLFPNGRLQDVENGLPYSLDGSHISIYGSRQIASEFLEADGFAELSKFISSPDYQR
ncbi:acyltransferase family protein [Pelagovum pacificum]|uniref:Acyltransferase n=1 Tax=Pelagovum pacificum TaxID=2588711 RepID=A0A5C5GJC2_9RHOB|nr:acyltransferase family protein [Pelagovum pacificum]QQA42602.1 acyltransferase [Pelagovum pacificum]TNY34247.1 acyltransferase [Pelagovum pacificum]